MKSLTDMRNLIYASGCALPADIEYYAILDCYSGLEKISLAADKCVNNLKRYFIKRDFRLFVRLIGEIREMLSACYMPLLASDCEYLIEQIKNEKHELCETLLDRFCANLTSLSVTFQTNHFRFEDKNSCAGNKRTTAVHGNNPLILAVDDSPEILRTLQSILGGKYRFFAVSSGFSALKILAQYKPDLFIFDIDMPNMNGFELAQKAHIKDVPLVFLTSNSNRENLITALMVGAADFLVKPCDRAIILEKIKKILGI